LITPWFNPLVLEDEMRAYLLKGLKPVLIAGKRLKTEAIGVNRE
jgi:hypothetical protein